MDMLRYCLENRSIHLGPQSLVRLHLFCLSNWRLTMGHNVVKQTHALIYIICQTAKGPSFRGRTDCDGPRFE
jgi:hypothetical protein